MIPPIPLVKGAVHTVRKLLGRIVSFSPFPTRPVQIEAFPAPVERSLTHPYPWDRDERDGPRQKRPEVSRSRDLPSTGRKQVEHRQPERLPRREPEHETPRRATRRRSR
jgi:hypothetical protein